jgi:Flp pilus assembly protein TadD
MASGDSPSAIRHLTRALDLDPRLARAHNALAAVLVRQRRLPDAVAQWQKALELDPHLFDALYNLGVSLWDAGRHEEARPYLERFVREAPARRYAADLARLRKMMNR